MATTPFKPSIRIENAYLRALRELLQRELNSIGRNSKTVEMLTSLLYESAQHPTYQGFADRLAGRMVAAVAVQNAKSWREAAAQSNQGRRIYELLQRELAGGPGLQVQQIVRENAQLMRSLPLDLAQEATALVSKRQQEGLRSSEIAKELRARLPKLAENRIQLIARTEVGKSEFAITSVRAQSLGLNHFIWRTSEGDPLDEMVSETQHPARPCAPEQKLQRIHVSTR